MVDTVLWANGYCTGKKLPQDLAPWLKTKGVQQRKLLQEMFEYSVARRKRNIEAFGRSSQPHVVVLEGADHYVFLTHQADVLREVRAFVAELQPHST